MYFGEECKILFQTGGKLGNLPWTLVPLLIFATGTTVSDCTLEPVKMFLPRAGYPTSPVLLVFIPEQ